MCSIKQFLYIKHLKYEIHLICNMFSNSPSNRKRPVSFYKEKFCLMQCKEQLFLFCDSNKAHESTRSISSKLCVIFA
jgi:hypothetical protein